MKIKVKAEDFIVNEKVDIVYADSGEYYLYSLTKKGFNTLDLLIRLSRRFGIPLYDISYGGKKDRYALTTQHITIKGKRIPDIKERNYTISYLGKISRPMGPDLIKGNEFIVNVRDLNEGEAQKAMGEIEMVSNYGLPNYFDDQRFGSYSPEQGFIAEKILKKHYNGAVKIYLTAVYPGDKKAEKERKRFFFQNWGNWEECLSMAKTDFERRAFKILVKKEQTPFLRILDMIPGEELSLFFSAYQSYLWNRIAEGIVRIYGGEVISYRGNYWPYIFWKRPFEFDYLRNLIIPTPSGRAVMPDELTERLYSEILSEQDLKKSSFNLKKIRRAFFKSFPRPLVVIPVIKGVEVDRDEIYADKKILRLHFELPRGSYGTMLIKRVMADQ